MGINRLLKKARTTHPAIGWLYLLAALVIHSCAFATSSVAQQGREVATTSTAPANDVSPEGQGGAVDSSAPTAPPEAASNKEKAEAPVSRAEPAPSATVSSTIPPAPPPPQLSDRRYQDLLQQFLSLKDKLYKAELAKGADRDDSLIRQLNAQIAEVQAQLEVLDQEKRAAGEVNEFLKDRLRKTESDLETVSKSGGIEKIRDLQSENASLQTELTKLRLDLDQMEKVRRESSQVPREIQEKLHRAEEEIRRSNLSTDERSKSLMEENQSLKNKLVDLQQQFQAQMAALQNEKKSNSETAEALHSKVEKAEAHLNTGSSTGDPTLDSATNDNNSLKTEVSKLREELRLQNEIYEKEKKANEQIARVLKDQLERAEKQLNFARTERPDDARYEALRTKNLHLRSELDRVRNLFATQLEDLEKDKRNLTDSSRALAERLQQAESELRIARTTPPAPTYAQTPVIQVEQQPVPTSIPATQVTQQASPHLGTATSVAMMPPDGAPEIAIKATPVTLEPDQPAGSRKAESRSERVRTEAPAELGADSAVASRIGELEEQLKEISSRTDSRFQALLDQQKAIRSDVGRIASREPGIVDAPGRPPLNEGEAPSSLSDRLARIEEGLKNLDTEATLIKADNAKLQTQLEVVEKEKRLGAEAVNSVHQRLKTAEAQLAEGGSADLSKIQAQIEDLNKVKTMSAEVVGVLHQRPEQ
jgi:myosin heavy subunit